MTYLLLIVGFILLIKGADYFVDGAVSIATLLKVSPMLIGLTIVAFGTSSPEGAVSIRSAMGESGGISLGNAIGSNIFNMTLIVGVTAMIYPLKVETQTIRKEIPFMFLSSILLFVLMIDDSLQLVQKDQLTRGDGLVLLLFFVIFMYYLFEVARHSRKQNIEDPKEVKRLPKGKSILFTIGGLVAIMMGGELVVRSSTEIARTFGLSETLIGLTLAATGTSLPELITSITAARKQQTDLAIGNIVGSNIFNILFVLGTSSVVATIPVADPVIPDVLLMTGFTLMLWIVSQTEHKIIRQEGMVLVLAYIGYMVYILWKN